MLLTIGIYMVYSYCTFQKRGYMSNRHARHGALVRSSIGRESRSQPTRKLAPGTVVTFIFRSRAVSDGYDKPRPAVLLAPVNGEDNWFGLSFTTNSTYKSTNQRRILLTDWQKVGLVRPTYFWSAKIIRVSIYDVQKVTGTITLAAAQQICELLKLPADRAHNFIGSIPTLS